jgi:uncharacterized phage-associated protein
MKHKEISFYSKDDSISLQLKDKANEKLLNVILFLSSKIKIFGIVKLLKLVFEIDKRHIREVGKPVFYLNYEAWELGPVSKDLYYYIKQNKLPTDWFNYLEINQDTFDSQFSIKPKKIANMDVFTPRQMRIINELLHEFKELNSQEYIDATHKEGEPWSIAFARGKNSAITINDILGNDNSFTPEYIQYYIDNHKEIQINFESYKSS